MERAKLFESIVNLNECQMQQSQRKVRFHTIRQVATHKISIEGKWLVMSRAKDTYKEVRTYTYPNCIVRVHIPDISEEERNRRMESIKDAASRLLKEAIRKGVIESESKDER